MGGFYADMDTECLENIEPLLNADCCFGTDTKDNIIYADLVKEAYLNNTYIASAPQHPFLDAVIHRVFHSEAMFTPHANKLLRVF